MSEDNLLHFFPFQNMEETTSFRKYNEEYFFNNGKTFSIRKEIIKDGNDSYETLQPASKKRQYTSTSSSKALRREREEVKYKKNQKIHKWPTQKKSKWSKEKESIETTKTKINLRPNNSRRRRKRKIVQKQADYDQPSQESKMDICIDKEVDYGNTLLNEDIQEETQGARINHMGGLFDGGESALNSFNYIPPPSSNRAPPAPVSSFNRERSTSAVNANLQLIRDQLNENLDRIDTDLLSQREIAYEQDINLSCALADYPSTGNEV